MRYLIVDFSDGTRWRIPASVIAADLAKFYSDKGDDYDAEFKYAMTDKYELEDWAFNNMNWEDVQDKAEQIEKSKEEVDYEDEWLSCNHWTEEQ